MGAIFNADASASNVTSDGAVFRDFDAAPSMDVADNLAIDNHFAGPRLGDLIDLYCRFKRPSEATQK